MKDGVYNNESQMEDGVYNNESQVSVITLFLKKTQPSLTAQPKWYTLEQRSLKQRMVAPVRWHTTQLSTKLCCSEFSRFINAPFTVSYTSSDHSAQLRCTHLSTSKFSNLQNIWKAIILKCTVKWLCMFSQACNKDQWNITSVRIHRTTQLGFGDPFTCDFSGS